MKKLWVYINLERENFLYFIASEKGSILILTLWTVAFLGIFASYIGLQVGQKALLLASLEHRNQLHYIAEAGIKKAIAALRKDITRNGEQYNSYSKFYRHNNKDIFFNVSMGDGTFSVSYPYFDGSFNNRRVSYNTVYYGLEDEERKININMADRRTLLRLIRLVTNVSESKAKGLVDAILGWRSYGKRKINGLYSDDYYSNLQYPYKRKKAPFELLDELSLVQGFTGEIVKQLKPFITVYGDGCVNINTAGKAVLMSLGLDSSVADKILKIRAGPDGIDATADDYIFKKTFDVASEMMNFIPLTKKEVKQIDALNAWRRIKVSSSFYYIRSEAKLNRSNNRAVIECIYNVNKNKIEYWKERFYKL